MKPIRKNCASCKIKMQPEHIFKKDALYTCPNCNSVSSIYEEKDIIHEKKEFSKPEGIEFETIANDLHIYLNPMPSGETLRSSLLVGLLVFLFSAFFYIGNITLANFIFLLGSFLWFLMVLNFIRIDNRKYEVKLNYYELQFFELFMGFKRKRLEIPSREVDRIVIIKFDSNNTKKNLKDLLIIQSSQYQTFKPFHYSLNCTDQLKFLKYLIDTYLKIEQRESDISLKKNTDPIFRNLK